MKPCALSCSAKAPYLLESCSSLLKFCHECFLPRCRRFAPVQHILSRYNTKYTSLELHRRTEVFICFTEQRYSDNIWITSWNRCIQITVEIRHGIKVFNYIAAQSYSDNIWIISRNTGIQLTVEIRHETEIFIYITEQRYSDNI